MLSWIRFGMNSPQCWHCELTWQEDCLPKSDQSTNKLQYLAATGEESPHPCIWMQYFRPCLTSLPITSQKDNFSCRKLIHCVIFGAIGWTICPEISTLLSLNTAYKRNRKFTACETTDHIIGHGSNNENRDWSDIECKRCAWGWG